MKKGYWRYKKMSTIQDQINQWIKELKMKKFKSKKLDEQTNKITEVGN